MRITASVASVQSDSLPGIVKQLDHAGVNAYHLDSIESEEIFHFASHLRQFTDKPFDLHLITETPEKYWDLIRQSGIPEIHLQLENLKKPLFIPSDLKGKVGLAVLASTNPKLFSVYRKEAASILIMLTTPGKSGGKFKPEHFANIIRYREMYPETPMTVDGGVNHEVASVLRLMGIRTIVSGSYLFGNETIQQSVDLLHHHEETNWTIQDVMARGTEIFTVSEKSFGVNALSWWINSAGQVNDISRLPDWQFNLEQISTFAELSGDALFVDELLKISTLKKTIASMTQVPRYVFAVDEHLKITGSFFIQIPEHDLTSSK
jgi:pentose-5-phosphate-3-epimerase